MKPFDLMMLCRRRLAWYEGERPTVPHWRRTVVVPVHLHEATDGSAHFTIVAKCDKHAVLAEFPLEYVFAFALDLSTGGRKH